MTSTGPALLAVALSSYAAGGLAALGLARMPRWASGLAHGLAALGGLATLALGLGGAGGADLRLRVPWLLLPPGVELELDRLGGFFLVPIGGLAVATAIYGLGAERDRRTGRTGLLAGYNAFLLGLTLVPLAGNVLTFLVAWELMSLASYGLVMTDADDRSVARAGWVYALVTHAGLACLVAGMLLVAQHAQSVRFADWAAAAATMPGPRRTLAFVLLAVGFGSKAGLVPVHVWLPLAHPAAPSQVSALMSGVMVKLGVYGLIRLGFDWLPGGPPWWGAVLVLAGGASALLGVLYALVERDLKRLLACSTIENVGLVLLGVGAGLVFRASGLEALAALSVVAALIHCLNHALFKALLFLGAGAVHHATGTRNLDALGGLVRGMPLTAAAFLVGAVAIAALPPLNGFVGEWLTFHALLQSVAVPSPGLALVLLLGLAALALTAGLAVAVFVRAFGIGFLARPRSPAAAAAREAPVSCLVAMGLLAGACLALGLGAPLVLPGIAAVATGAGRLSAAPPLVAGALTIEVEGGFGQVSPVAVAALIALALGALGLAARFAGVGRRGHRRYETWSCGRSLQTARMEYTATAFSQPFKRIFAVLYRPVKQLAIEFHPGSRFFVETIRYDNPTRSLIEEWLYLPVLARAQRWAVRGRRLQSGSANLYLAYILVTLLVLLLVVR
jgi:hydrogenase-4 component B